MRFFLVALLLSSGAFAQSFDFGVLYERNDVSHYDIEHPCSEIYNEAYLSDIEKADNNLKAARISSILVPLAIGLGMRYERLDMRAAQRYALNKAIGISDLSEEEIKILIKEDHPEHEDITFLYEKNPIQKLTRMINAYVKYSVTVEEVKSYLASKKNTDYFCQNAEADNTKRSYLKDLGRRIKAEQNTF